MVYMGHKTVGLNKQKSNVLHLELYDAYNEPRFTMRFSIYVQNISTRIQFDASRFFLLILAFMLLSIPPRFLCTS